MKRKERNDIQKEAVEKWISHNKKGTCEIITGLGKTFIGLHCLRSMPNDDGKVHLFLAETTMREKDLRSDIKKYDKLFNTNLLKDYNLEFHCYQTVYKWKGKKFGLVIADEIHDSLSPAYSEFYKNNTYDAILGLTATVVRDTLYENDKGGTFSKGDLLDKYAPVIFKYGMNEGQNDNTSRKLEINVIYHDLEAIEKTVKAGNKMKPFMQTEKAAYEYWDLQFKRSLYIDDTKIRDFKIRIASHKRSNILYTLESKIPVVKKILSTLKGRTIVFGNSLDSLLKVTNDVVSSRNDDAKNDLIRKKFEQGKINVIGSFKKLKQGANLEGLDNCLIMSYYSTEKDLIQRLGRLRKNGDKIGKVFIIVTQQTKEEDWFAKMFENMEMFDVYYYKNINDYLMKVKK